MDCGVKTKIVYGDIYSRAFMCAAVAVLLVLATAGAGLAADADKVIMVVNGQELRQLHFDRVMDEMLPMSRFHGGVNEEVKAKNRQKALDKLIDDELLYQEAVKQGIKPDRKVVKAQLEESIKRVGGKKGFDEALEHYGVGLREFKRTLAKPGMVKEFLHRMVDSRAVVSEKEIKAYYERNRESHFMVHKRRFRHIVLKIDPGEASSWEAKREKAADILNKIREGEDFAKMARSFSDGPRREKGGDTGYIARGQLLPELVKAGWDMKPGDVSDLIQTIYGYHIIKLEEAPPSEAVLLEEARGQIESLMVSAQKQDLNKKLLEELRKKASIRMVNE